MQVKRFQSRDRNYFRQFHGLQLLRQLKNILSRANESLAETGKTYTYIHIFPYIHIFKVSLLTEPSPVSDQSMTLF